MAESRLKNSLLNAFTSIGSQIVITLLSFVNRTIFIYSLGKTYLGINGLFSNVLQMLSLTELGLNTAMNFKLYKPLAEKDYGRLRVLMKFYRLAYLVIGLVFIILGLCLIPFLPYLIKDYSLLDELNINAPLIFLMYLLNSASSYLFSASKSSIISADQKMYIFVLANVITSVVTNIFQIGSLLLFHNFILYTFISVVCGIISNLVVAHIATRMYPEAFSKTDEKMSKKEIRDTFKDMGSLFVYKVNNVILKATDNIVLSSCVGLAIVGAYSNYLMFYTTFNTLLTKMFDSVKASMGNFFVTEDDGAKYRLFKVSNFIASILFGTAGIGIFVCADMVVRQWIGTDYVLAQPLSLLIGVEIYTTGMKCNTEHIKNITGMYRRLWYIPLFCILINIVLSFGLVGTYGISGVIIGTIVSTSVMSFLFDPIIIYQYYFKNLKPISDYYIHNLLYIAALIIIGGLDYLLCIKIIPFHGWLSIFPCVLICGLSVPCVFLFAFSKKEECQYVLDLLKRMVLKLTKNTKYKPNVSEK